MSLSPEREQEIRQRLDWPFPPRMIAEVFAELDTVRSQLLAMTLERDSFKAELTHERGFLISCPWCGEKMNGDAISIQISHLITHGDKLKGERDSLRDQVKELTAELESLKKR